MEGVRDGLQKKLFCLSFDNRGEHLALNAWRVANILAIQKNTKVEWLGASQRKNILQH